MCCTPGTACSSDARGESYLKPSNRTFSNFYLSTGIYVYYSGMKYLSVDTCMQNVRVPMYYLSPLPSRSLLITHGTWLPSRPSGQLHKTSPAATHASLRQSIPCLQALPRRGLAEDGNAGWHWPCCQMPPHTPLQFLLALHMVAGVGHGSLIHRQGDGIQEPKGTCVSGRVIAALPWREHTGVWVPSLNLEEKLRQP